MSDELAGDRGAQIGNVVVIVLVVSLIVFAILFSALNAIEGTAEIELQEVLSKMNTTVQLQCLHLGYPDFILVQDNLGDKHWFCLSNSTSMPILSTGVINE